MQLYNDLGYRLSARLATKGETHERDGGFGVMMSNAHIAVGVASALALAQTGSVESCVAAVIGGSIGGIMADCDITPSRAHKDALRGRLIVAGIAVVAMLVDSRTDLGVCSYLVGHLGLPLVAGLFLFVALTFLGAHTDHRSFTHSLVAMAGFCYAVYLVCEPLLLYFAVGYASHLVLDVTNKQPIRLFWPLRAGVSLKLCTARGLANKIVCVAGIAVAALLLWYRLLPLLPV
ncbi:MAG: metal-dependent hydrolase [Eggerthellaceae bacterium]|nr:metal-dependent hydrolase [Eggerthellaceae bacterium]